MTEVKAGAERAARWAFERMKEIERDDEGIPLTLEGCVRHMILKSPDMFAYRDDALCNLYCVLGTGIEWGQHGRLRDRQPNNYLNLPPAVGRQGCWSRDFGMDETWKKVTYKAPYDVKTALEAEIARIEEWLRGELERVIAIVYDVDNRVKTCRPERRGYYPISWYECRLCVPGNANEDFVQGAIEMAGLIIATDAPPNTQQWIDYQKNRHYAEQMLRLLRIRA